MLPSTRLLPQLSRDNHRHEKLDGTGPVHLFANDLLDLTDGTQPQGQVIIDTGSELANHAGPQHQLMADNFRIRRGFFKSGKEIFSVTHITNLEIGEIRPPQISATALPDRLKCP